MMVDRQNDKTIDAMKNNLVIVKFKLYQLI